MNGYLLVNNTFNNLIIYFPIGLYKKSKKTGDSDLIPKAFMFRYTQEIGTKH